MRSEASEEFGDDENPNPNDAILLPVARSLRNNNGIEEEDAVFGSVQRVPTHVSVPVLIPRRNWRRPRTRYRARPPSNHTSGNYGNIFHPDMLD